MSDPADELERMERRIVDFDRRLQAASNSFAGLSPPVFWLKCVTWGLVVSGLMQLVIIVWVAQTSQRTADIRDDMRYEKKEQSSFLQDLAGWKAGMEYKLRAVMDALIPPPKK